MAKFKYTVKDKTGKTLKGIIEAATETGAVQSLRAKELVIIALKEQKGPAVSFAIFQGMKKGKVKIDDLAIFSRQLATMINAGIALVSALDILAEQIENRFFKHAISKVHDDIEAGSSLSEALRKHPEIFSNLFVNMVKAGESSGMLDEIMDRLSTYLEKTATLQKKIKSALVYPIAVTIMAFGITIFLMIKVVPVFKDIYAGFGAALPVPTQIMLNISDIMKQHFFLCIVLAIIAGFSINRYAKTKAGRYRIDRLKLNVPIFGILVKKMAVGKFARTLSTLVKSGVPILDSLEIVSKTGGNSVLERAVEKVRVNVKEGEPIADPLAKSGVFPPMVVRMISIGEQTGELEKMLTKVADFYETEVDAAVSGLTSLIEPLIIAFLGIVIGGMVICMFLPILQITSLIG